MPGRPCEAVITVRVPKAEVFYLRYTLEAYEGLCVPTTVGGGDGRVRLSTEAARLAELRQVLEAVGREIPLTLEEGDAGPPRGRPAPDRKACCG